MSSVVASAHWTRWAAVVAVVLGVLCGPAAFTAGATAGAGATAAATAGTSAESHSVEGATMNAAATPHTADTPTPGCRPSHPSDGAGQPAVPARHGAPYELVPALFDSRGAVGGWGLDRALACPTGRAPPPAGPPTPVDLSVLLRV
ncbi:hypothetical protein ACIQM4_12680 [Streptomyces sp. NPDC091272]|uniref:hypothetical protein n=1 Tax=Streptomyces sp. NPDC091272 TaxID=3365981 RepID=UPI00383085DA